MPKLYRIADTKNDLFTDRKNKEFYYSLYTFIEKRLRKSPSLTDAGAVRSASDSAIPCAYIRGFACFLIEPACCDDTVIGIEAITILSEAVEISDE